MAPLFDVPRNVKQIPSARTEEQISAALQVLQKKALENGATEAHIIKGSQIIFSNDILARVAADKAYASFNWPLNLPKDDMREVVSAFRYGIYFGILSPKPLPEYGGGPIQNDKHRQLYGHLYALVADIESTSFYMGYHLALGLAAGNCRAVFCHKEDRCLAMVKGRGCIHPYKARPSMEAAGIDAASMAHGLSMRGASDNVLLTGLVMIE